MSVSEEEDESEEHRLAREQERQRVLEAAGLIVKTDRKAPPRPPMPQRRQSKRVRRAPPPAPAGAASPTASTPTKELPATPPQDEAVDMSAHLDDAFDRYEAFKQSRLENNRLSVASSDVPPASPPSPSPFPPLERTISTDVETSRSHGGFFSSLLGRKTPANDEKKTTLVISGPMAMGPLSAGAEEPTRAGSPAFGTVSPVSQYQALTVRLTAASLGQAWSTARH
jgi:hypothetical protein